MLNAATRGDRVYNQKLVDGQETSDTQITDQETMPSPIQDGTLRAAPPVWDGACVSNPSIVYEAREHDADAPVGAPAAATHEFEVESLPPVRSDDQTANMPGTSNDESGANQALTQIHEDKTMFQQLERFLDTVKQGYKVDPWFDKVEHTKRLVRDSQGLYWKGHSLAIPGHKDLRVECLRLCHDAPWAAHLGRDKTSQLVSSMYYWPGIYDDVRHHVSTCLQCQRNKPSNRRPAGLMVTT
jgi:hypothetical protein